VNYQQAKDLWDFSTISSKMIIIAKLEYYDNTHKTIPIEAESVEDAYEKVRNVISKYRKDCDEYYEWKHDVFKPLYEEINNRLINARENRRRFCNCNINYDIEAERIRFYSVLDKIDKGIDKILKEGVDLYHSREEPMESDYANFKISGLDVSKWNFKTLEEWLKEMGEIY
jgi:hypothetical protein